MLTGKRCPFSKEEMKSFYDRAGSAVGVSELTGQSVWKTKRWLREFGIAKRQWKTGKSSKPEPKPVPNLHIEYLLEKAARGDRPVVTRFVSITQLQRAYGDEFERLVNMILHGEAIYAPLFRARGEQVSAAFGHS